MDDDDLRDRFGDELTEALRSRSRSRPAEIDLDIDPVGQRVDRTHARRRIMAAVSAAVIGAGGTALIALHAHSTARVNVSSHASTTSGGTRPSFAPDATGVADWTWVSADHGWALVRKPCGTTVCMTLRETTDGGRRWTTVRTPELLDTHAQDDADTACQARLCVSGVRFLDANTGWLFGPAFLETKNGGNTWTGGHGPGVIDVEASEGVALRLTSTSSAGCGDTCPSQVERAQPATGVWRRVSGPVAGDATLLILRTDAYVVSVPDLAATSRADLRRSHDRGATWTSMSDPCADGGSKHVTTSASEAPDGVLVVLCSARTPPVSPFIRISGDGGQTFGTRRAVPVDAYEVVRAASADTLLVGDRTGVMVSTDRGATWHTTLVASGPGTVALGWENPQTARASFNTNAIWTTRDAGQNWTKNAVTP